ncbi:hypothetical protein Tco_0059262 [Tanacetum coccineum]
MVGERVSILIGLLNSEKLSSIRFQFYDQKPEQQRQVWKIYSKELVVVAGVFIASVKVCPQLYSPALKSFVFPEVFPEAIVHRTALLRTIWSNLENEVLPQKICIVIVLLCCKLPTRFELERDGRLSYDGVPQGDILLITAAMISMVEAVY